MTIDDLLLKPILESGEKIYHYTSAAGLQGICEGDFWVTESGFLNDFREFHVATDIFCKMFDKHMNNKELCEEVKGNTQVPDTIKYLRIF